MEKQGLLGGYLDLSDEDARFGQPSFEQAESELQHLALNAALAKAKLSPSDIDVVLSGDLINQCTSSTYGLSSFGIPFLGIYGACSTMAQGLLIASLLVGSLYTRRAAAVTSSHFCSAERQFRSPLEYGAQRTPTSQHTVTGAGAFLLGADAEELSRQPYISQVLIGKIVDYGINDAANMGAAMAPAAIDTLSRYFAESGKEPSSFDLIATGDLGSEGEYFVRTLLADEGIELGKNYSDCGCLIYDLKNQDVNAGGSGCGCSAVTAAGYVMECFRIGAYRDVLLIGTGALMSPLAIAQGMAIPAIAHLVRISAWDAEI